MNCNISNIRSSMHSFFKCTHIPIKSFSSDGKEVFSVGYTEIEERLFIENFTAKVIKENSYLLESKSYVIYKVSTNINYVICSICHDSLNCGLFLLGPYRIDDMDNLNIIFKPKEYMHYILDLLYSITHGSPNQGIKLVKPKKECNLYVNKAIKYVEENYSSQISLESISKYLRINKAYFCDLFKKTTEKTFIQFLNEFRIEKSKDLLLKDDLSITEISFIVGFSSHNYYNTQFKKVTGKSPKNWRIEVNLSD